MDAGRSVESLFTDDGVLVVPDPPAVLDPSTLHQGHAAIAAATSNLPPTFHEIVGQVYDGTVGRIACVAHHLVDATTDVVWHLHYADTYEQVRGHWLIARRELWIDFIETRPVRRTRWADRP